MHSTLLRCETQATDSTFNGWNAKSAAVTRLGARRRVALSKKRKRKAAFRAWSNALTAWCAPARIPKSETSTMCETSVRGCQLPTSKAVSAHRRLSQVSP